MEDYILGKGRAAGRVGSDFCWQSRVGSDRVNISAGRVGSKKSDPWTTLAYMYSAHDILNWIEWNLIHLRDAAYKSTSAAIQRIIKWN